MDKTKSKFLINLDDYVVKRRYCMDITKKGYAIMNKKTKKEYLAFELILREDGEQITDANLMQQIDEVEATMYFQHPTFVEYIGFAPFDLSHSPGVTTVQNMHPFARDLIDSIHKGNIPESYTNTSKQIMLVGIARAMMLIQQTDFLYVLLSPDNIFLDDNFHPMLSPSFCSKIPKKELQKQMIPLYAPPEKFEDLDVFNDKSDVFSFGILMYEILTGIRPYSELKGPLSTFKLINSIVKGYRPKFQGPIKESFKELIEQCWSTDPNDRPSFETIYKLLAYSDEFYLDDINLEEYKHYVESIKKDMYLPSCHSCDKRIKRTETIFYSGYPFHKECVKCIICDKTLKSNQATSEFICITNGIFFCKQHYNEFRNSKKLPKSALDKIKEKNKKNLVNDIFNKKFFNDFDILNQNPNDVFITFDMVENSYQKEKPYECFIPIVTFHFSNFPDYIDFKNLDKIFKNNMIILSIDRGSTIIKAAYTGTKDKIKSYISSIKNILLSEEGKSIIGKLIEEPKIEYPDENKINDLYQCTLANELQGSDKLNETQINELKKEVLKNIINERSNKNWKLISAIQSMINPFEIQIKEDIKNNPFEMIVVGQATIVTEHFKKYISLKNSIAKKTSIKVIERILYHGSRLDNHQKIVKTHFLMPGKDEVKQLDKGYYGKGIYATENIFYASMYGNGFSILKYNEKAPVICCTAIYNESCINEIQDKSYYGKKISSKIAKSYGIHHALVGNSTNFWPISPSNKDKNYLVAEEFVFPYKYQIIPICSIIVMRADHLIVWKDENIDNNENKQYFDYLSSKMKMAVYIRKTVEDAVNLIKLKKFNKIKLITNGGINLTGKKLIQEARKIIKSNFVCLVFSKSTDHLKWINKMENVLFTNDPEMFKKFAALQLAKQDVLNYIKLLEYKHMNKFNINEEELLKFCEI